MEFRFECSTRYKDEHKKRHSISTSNCVLLCLRNKHTNIDIFNLTIFGRFAKIFQNLSEGHANVSEHFSEISKDFRG